MSALAGDKNCRVDVIFPFGIERLDDGEVLNTFDGPISSLTVEYVHTEMNKALAPLDIEVSGQGESSDFKILVGFSGLLNKSGSKITDAYLQVKNYERSVESRKNVSLLGMLKKREKIAKKLFDKALKDLVPLLDKCQ